MQEENLAILRALKQNIEEISPSLEAAQLEFFEGESEKVRNGVDLIMTELTMVVLMLTGTDSEVAARELELLNDMRHVVYGHGIQELASNDYLELCREFLSLYPNALITLDHPPLSVRVLKSYDQTHGTDHANKARTIFIQFADAIVKVDNNEHPNEVVILENFKDTLNRA
jgi:hypothetical protein